MKTENEIKALPLEEQQKLVLDLKSVPQSDRYFETAQRLIKFTEGLKSYKAPEAIAVTNIAEHDISVDGKIIPKGQSGTVFPWQLRALGRWLEKAALVMFAALLLTGRNAAAQVQTTLIGGPGGYYVRSLTALNGGAIPVGVNTNFLTPVTNSVIVTNANWSVQNGQATNQVTYTTNNTVNQPGVFSLTGYDQWTMSYSGQMMAGTTNVTSVANVDYSTDLVNWQTNKWSLPITMAATTQVTTNLDVTGCNGGYIRVDTVTMAANVPETNCWFEVSTKSSSHGP